MDVGLDLGLRQRVNASNSTRPAPARRRATRAPAREIDPGVGPADSTGKSVTRCWPGARRCRCASGRGRRRRKPRKCRFSHACFYDFGRRMLRNGHPLRRAPLFHAAEIIFSRSAARPLRRRILGMTTEEEAGSGNEQIVGARISLPRCRKDRDRARRRVDLPAQRPDELAVLWMRPHVGEGLRCPRISECRCRRRATKPWRCRSRADLTRQRIHVLEQPRLGERRRSSLALACSRLSREWRRGSQRAGKPGQLIERDRHCGGPFLESAAGNPTPFALSARNSRRDQSITSSRPGGASQESAMPRAAPSDGVRREAQEAARRAQDPARGRRGIRAPEAIRRDAGRCAAIPSRRPATSQKAGSETDQALAPMYDAPFYKGSKLRTRSR